MHEPEYITAKMPGLFWGLKRVKELLDIHRNCLGMNLLGLSLKKYAVYKINGVYDVYNQMLQKNSNIHQ